MSFTFRQRMEAQINRFIMNIWPCIRGAGGKVVTLSPDYMNLVVRLKLNWRTRNIVGTIYGGSMYASTDPFYMLMFHKLLGPDYIVWDKACSIRFLRPAKETIYAEFLVTPEMLREVRETVLRLGKANFTWTIAYKNREGQVFAEFDKTIYVAQKSVYKQRQSGSAMKEEGQS